MVRPRLVRHAALPFDLLLERLVCLPSVDFDRVRDGVQPAEVDGRDRPVHRDVEVDRDPFGHADLLATVVDELVPFPEEAEGGPVVRLPDVLGGEVEVEVFALWGLDPRRFGVAGCYGEAGVVPFDEPRHEGVGLLYGRDAVEPELRDQAVLEGPPEAFDPPLRLADGRGDDIDAELLADPSELRVRVEFDGKAVDGHPPVDEDRAVVAVKGLRNAVFLEYRPSHVQIAIEGFVDVEVAREDLAGRVVDRPVGGGLGAVGAEPPFLRGVYLDELAFPRTPRPAWMRVLRPLPLLCVRRRYARVGQDPIYLVVGGVDALPLFDELEEMREVEAIVFPEVEAEYPRLLFLARLVRGLPVLVAVREA